MDHKGAMVEAGSSFRKLLQYPRLELRMVSFFFFLQNSDRTLVPVRPLRNYPSLPYHCSTDDNYLFIHLSPPSDFELSKSGACCIYLCVSLFYMVPAVWYSWFGDE